jgi:hypothetical protein
VHRTVNSVALLTAPNDDVPASKEARLPIIANCACVVKLQRDRACCHCKRSEAISRAVRTRMEIASQRSQ